MRNIAYFGKSSYCDGNRNCIPCLLLGDVTIKTPIDILYEEDYLMKKSTAYNDKLSIISEMYPEIKLSSSPVVINPLKIHEDLKTEIFSCFGCLTTINQSYHLYSGSQLNTERAYNCIWCIHGLYENDTTTTCCLAFIMLYHRENYPKKEHDRYSMDDYFKEEGCCILGIPITNYQFLKRKMMAFKCRDLVIDPLSHNKIIANQAIAKLNTDWDILNRQVMEY